MLIGRDARFTAGAAGKYRTRKKSLSAVKPPAGPG
jgi:hypothetical protein